MKSETGLDLGVGGVGVGPTYQLHTLSSPRFNRCFSPNQNPNLWVKNLDPGSYQPYKYESTVNWTSKWGSLVFDLWVYVHPTTIPINNTIQYNAIQFNTIQYMRWDNPPHPLAFTNQHHPTGFLHLSSPEAQLPFLILNLYDIMWIDEYSSVVSLLKERKRKKKNLSRND